MACGRISIPMTSLHLEANRELIVPAPTLPIDHQVIRVAPLTSPGPYSKAFLPACRVDLKDRGLSENQNRTSGLSASPRPTASCSRCPKDGVLRPLRTGDAQRRKPGRSRDKAFDQFLLTRQHSVDDQVTHCTRPGGSPASSHGGQAAVAFLIIGCDGAGLHPGGYNAPRPCRARHGDQAFFCRDHAVAAALIKTAGRARRAWRDGAGSLVAVVPGRFHADDLGTSTSRPPMRSSASRTCWRFI